MKRNYLKEKLIWLRLWLTILVTLISACFAWLINSFSKASKILTFSDTAFIFVLLIILFTINQKIRNYLQHMEDKE